MRTTSIRNHCVYDKRVLIYPTQREPQKTILPIQTNETNEPKRNTKHNQQTKQNETKRNKLKHTKPNDISETKRNKIETHVAVGFCVVLCCVFFVLFVFVLFVFVFRLIVLCGCCFFCCYPFLLTFLLTLFCEPFL